MTVQLEIPADIVSAMRLPEPEIPARLRLELALALYAQGVLGLGKARQLAEMSVLDFGLALGRRGIPRQYDDGCLEQDLTYARGE